jgi:hypothetical protein
MEAAMKRVSITLLVVVGLGLLALLAYRIYDPTGGDINDMTWTETVALASGEMASIERHVRFQTYSVFGLGGQSSGPVDEVDSIAMVGPANFVSWTGPIRPMLLDRDPDTNEWIIVAADEQGGPGNLWGANGKPCPPQWAFRLHDGQWYIQPVPVNLLGRGPNLLVDLRVSDDAKFSRASFPAEVVARKRAQMQSNSGVPIDMRSVGVVATFENTCRSVSPPAFMGPFRDKYVTGEPIPRAMNNFPRLP